MNEVQNKEINEYSKTIESGSKNTYINEHAGQHTKKWTNQRKTITLSSQRI